MDYFAHNVAIVFLISQTLLLLSIAQFIEDPTDDPKCKNESIYGFRESGSFYSGDSDAVFQDDLCSVKNYESLLLRTDDDYFTYKRIIKKVGQDLWLPVKYSLNSDCKKIEDCNGTLKFSTTNEPLYFYGWMNAGEIAIKLEKEDNCAIIQGNGRIQSRKCSEKHAFICRATCRPKWGKCINYASVDYRYKEANILLSGTVEEVQECASACSLNTSCVYWTYEETSQVCRLLPSGALDMTQEIARTGQIRRGNRYCHPKFCLKPTFERGWVMAESEDSTKMVYYPKDKIEYFPYEQAKATLEIIDYKAPKEVAMHGSLSTLGHYTMIQTTVIQTYCQ